MTTPSDERAHVRGAAIMAALLLLNSHDSPRSKKDRHNENYGAHTTAFPSLSEREFHASHPEEGGGDDAAAVQFEEDEFAG